MLSSEATTLVRLSKVLRDLRLSKTLRTGSEHGLLRDKECTTEQSQCKSQVKILPTQQSSIPEVVN